jgi:hypothetical protein
MAVRDRGGSGANSDSPHIGVSTPNPISSTRLPNSAPNTVLEKQVTPCSPHCDAAIAWLPIRAHIEMLASSVSCPYHRALSDFGGNLHLSPTSNMFDIRMTRRLLSCRKSVS